jgi:hypothetical protein
VPFRLGPPWPLSGATGFGPCSMRCTGRPRPTRPGGFMRCSTAPLDPGGRQAVHAGRVRAGVARDPLERHQQRRRVTHEVEQVIEPAARVGRRPTVKLGLHPRYPLLRPDRVHQRGAGIHRRVFGIAASMSSRNRCRPWPCARLSRAPTTTAAPPRPSPIGRRWTQPDRHAGCVRPGRTGTVPVFTAIRSTKKEPSSAPAASPRLPRSTSPWPPTRHPHARSGVPRPQRRDAPLPARIHQV